VIPARQHRSCQNHNAGFCQTICAREDISTLILLMLVTMVEKEQKTITSDTRDENVREEAVVGYLRWQ